jgi:hypothetical protein
VDLLTAIAGGDFAIKHLDDRVLHVTIVPGEVIKPGTSRSLYNYRSGALVGREEAAIGSGCFGHVCRLHGSPVRARKWIHSCQAYGGKRPVSGQESALVGLEGDSRQLENAWTSTFARPPCSPWPTVVTLHSLATANQHTRRQPPSLDTHS